MPDDLTLSIARRVARILEQDPVSLDPLSDLLPRYFEGSLPAPAARLIHELQHFVTDSDLRGADAAYDRIRRDALLGHAHRLLAENGASSG